MAEILEGHHSLLGQKYHIGWQLVMKELHSLEERESTILVLGRTCRFLREGISSGTTGDDAIGEALS
jgi:hypothetical protein